MTDESEVLFERRGVSGVITLNRPKALNALTHGMCLALKAKLDEWAADNDVSMVIIKAAGDRAFCAGGDIRALYESGKAGTPYVLDFYRDEYILNTTIKRFPKPYTALIGGIVMGGGVGVSVHGFHRIADETTMFAMPETGIGLFPDVGGSYFLPRCPGEIGMYLALTGARLKADDALYAGIATAVAEGLSREELVETLLQLDLPPNLMPLVEGGYATRNNKVRRDPPPLALYREKIDSVFSANSAEEILARLDADDTEWSAETAKTIRAKSPTATKLAVQQIRNGKKLGFEDCMRMEFRMVSRVIAGHDFYEGVRATIIDKDQSPKWKPATLEAVSDADIDAYFAPLGEKELKL